MNAALIPLRGLVAKIVATPGLRRAVKLYDVNCGAETSSPRMGWMWEVKKLGCFVGREGGARNVGKRRWHKNAAALGFSTAWWCKQLQ